MDSLLSKAIGQRINARLAETGKKQKELAMKLGVTDNTVSYYCSGKRLPNTAQIKIISEYLECTADYLLGLTDTPTIDKDMRYICEYTGLDSIAVADLHRLKLNEATLEIAILNSLIKSYIIVEIAECEQVISKGTEKQISVYKQIIQSFYNANDFELSEIELSLPVIKLSNNKETKDDIDYNKFKSQKKIDEWFSSFRFKEETTLNNHREAVNFISGRYNFYRNFTNKNAESLKNFKTEIKKYLSLYGIEIPKGEDNGDDQETQ